MPRVQVHFSLCLLLYWCFLRCGGCFEPIPSRPALKVSSGHLCCDKFRLDISTWSFSCAIWGCVSGLRFCSPSAIGSAMSCGAEGPHDELWDWGQCWDAVLGAAWGAHQEPLLWKTLRCCVWAAEPYMPEDLLLPLLES